MKPSSFSKSLRFKIWLYTTIIFVVISLFTTLPLPGVIVFSVILLAIVSGAGAPDEMSAKDPLSPTYIPEPQD